MKRIKRSRPLQFLLGFVLLLLIGGAAYGLGWGTLSLFGGSANPLGRLVFGGVGVAIFAFVVKTFLLARKDPTIWLLIRGSIKRIIVPSIITFIAVIGFFGLIYGTGRLAAPVFSQFWQPVDYMNYGCGVVTVVAVVAGVICLSPRLGRWVFGRFGLEEGNEDSQ